MINGRRHCLNMALELELGTLPCSSECDTSDTEPVSPKQLLLGSALGAQQNHGLGWKRPASPVWYPRSREEAGA